MIEDEKIEFDLLVSDLHMPGMDGDELVDVLSQMSSGKPAAYRRTQHIKS